MYRSIILIFFKKKILFTNKNQLGESDANNLIIFLDLCGKDNYIYLDLDLRIVLSKND